MAAHLSLTSFPWYGHPAARAARVAGACALMLCAAALPAGARTPTPTPATIGQFNLQLTTTRGCFETGQNPVYAVGETITVSFRIRSTTAPRATATLFDILPNGVVGVFSFGPVVTNQTLAFGARVAPPLGVEQLLLRASAPGVQTARRSCSFRVVAALTPGVTPTSPATATPTSTPTAATVTATPTPAAQLGAMIRTNRGCLEHGDNPTFVVGELIQVFFRINSPTLPQARATIFDILPTGFVNVFSFGFVPTNLTLPFRGRIVPPLGIETLQLRAQAFGVPSATDTCSFRVVAGPPATPTRTPAAPTPTATPTPTGTPP